MKKLILFMSLLFNLNLFAIPSASAWDGAVYAIKDFLAENANDPKSIKIAECSPILELSNGGWAQRVKFRGKNAFGGTVLNEYMFLIAGDGDNAVVLSAASLEEFSEALTSNNIEVIASYNHDGTKF